MSAEQRPPAEPSYAPGRAPLSGALWRDARPAPGLCLSSPPASTSRPWRNTFLLSLLWTLLRVPGENGSSPPWPLCGEDPQTLFGGEKKSLLKNSIILSPVKFIGSGSQKWEKGLEPSRFRGPGELESDREPFHSIQVLPALARTRRQRRKGVTLGSRAGQVKSESQEHADPTSPPHCPGEAAAARPSCQCGRSQAWEGLQPS